ncbi:MAG TPA: FAD-dependent oxidoreductase [Chthoniobacteraceae bacterium]|jgi:glycine/D-amino acid oxidase-like deaminating enzyme/nitrite reductase/ring-hydroxylating ferredoxin subunit
MDTTPFWINSAELPHFLPLTENLHVDVLVVGGGITGITAAYLLKKAGKTVALVEREELAVRDTGHTTAHVTHVTDLRLSELVNQLGRDHAQAFWDANAAAMEQIAQNVCAERIDCELRRVPGYLHAAIGGNADRERESLQEDAHLAQEFGFDAGYLDSITILPLPGVRFANQLLFHPRKYLAGLVAQIPGEGSHVYEKAPVDKFLESPRRAVVNGREISFTHLVLATHYPLQGYVDAARNTLFQTKLAPYSTYAIGVRLPLGTLPEAAFWDTSDPYYYLRVDRRDGDDYVIFGGCDHKTGQESDTDEPFRQLFETLRSFAPQAVIADRWTGQVIETPDGLPFIGEITEGQFISTGYSGNGTTLGTLGGMMARDWVLGVSNPWQELFAPERKKAAGAWDYVKENKDYPYYMVKDRLKRSEGHTLSEVANGEGKLLRINGEKLAVYRDEAGKVSASSATCPHLGCIVGWNQAERSWDCPCHGSRFHPTGEVFAGPAEAPLSPRGISAGVENA